MDVGGREKQFASAMSVVCVINEKKGGGGGVIVLQTDELEKKYIKCFSFFLFIYCGGNRSDILILFYFSSPVWRFHRLQQTHINPSVQFLF